MINTITTAKIRILRNDPKLIPPSDWTTGTLLATPPNTLVIFNNPTNSILSINIIFNNSSEETNLVIPSLGTKFLRIKNYYGSLSFESRLPICRALIFKNPTPNDHGTFDVFHSWKK